MNQFLPVLISSTLTVQKNIERLGSSVACMACLMSGMGGPCLHHPMLTSPKEQDQRRAGQQVGQLEYLTVFSTDSPINHLPYESQTLKASTVSGAFEIELEYLILSFCFAVFCLLEKSWSLVQYVFGESRFLFKNYLVRITSRAEVHSVNCLLQSAKTKSCKTTAEYARNSHQVNGARTQSLCVLLLVLCCPF